MQIARLLYSVGGTDITEYPDFDQALQDVITGSNRDFANMTLMSIELDTGDIGTVYDGKLLSQIANDDVQG